MTNALEKRQCLEQLIAEKASDWKLTGASTGMGGFDISYTLPDGTYLQVDGSVDSRELDWVRFSADQSMDCDPLELGAYQSLCDSITAEFYPEKV